MSDVDDERLSRHLDGDLSGDEAGVLAAELRARPELRRRLEALEGVRGALRSLAASEQPPPALDAVVEPLVRGVPTAAPRRPWLWLAAAAAIVLAVALLRVGGGPLSPWPSSDWQERAARRGDERAAPFALAPLPSATSEAGERPRGAVDRLLASAPPEVEAPEETPPLVVMGPLSAADGAALERSRRNRSDGAPGWGASGGVPPTAADPAAEGRLLIFMGSETAWRAFQPQARCEPGRYALRLRVEGGVVRAVWPVWRPVAAPYGSLQAAELVAGLEVPGVPAGEYAAEVVIEPPSHGRR